MKTDQGQINTKESNPIFSDVNLEKTPHIANLALFFVKDFLYWWYIQMPVFYLIKLERISLVISDQLSITLLLKNFFMPWKRDKSVIGYSIGIITKLIYLPIAIPIHLAIILIYIGLMIVWTLLPLVTIFFILISLFLR